MSGGGSGAYLPACLCIHRRYNGDWVKETATIKGEGKKKTRDFSELKGPTYGHEDVSQAMTKILQPPCGRRLMSGLQKSLW